MKTKLVNAEFNADTGVSTVTIATPNGFFTGTAKLHPLDAQYASEFAGCEYAEMRANIKYMKSILHDYKLSYKTIHDFYNSLSCRADFDEYNMEARKLRREMFYYTEKINNMKANITSAEKSIKTKITLRDSTHKKLADWAKMNK